VFLIVVLGVALSGVTAWGYTATQDLQGQLATSQAQFATSETRLADEQQKTAALTSQVTNLNSRVAAQTSCIAALKSKADALERIRLQQVAISNMTAEGSMWAAASVDRTTAFLAALDDYYKAFSAAWDGRKTTANSWIDKGNAEYRRVTEATATMNAEIDKVTSLMNEAYGMLSMAAAINLDACGGGADGTT
jgi:chromosome segregation ATPase